MSTGAVLAATTTNSPAPRNVGDPATFGRGIQRTMTLLANGQTARILFYGQSITEQKWVTNVMNYLRARFPHANLIMENRALGGFASQRLVKTAEADLYSFSPDLMIFYVFGAHTDYEDIIRRTRERTTAEILIQTDHLSAKAKLDEETDPAQLAPERKMWSQFMNYKFLPEIIRKYGCGFVDQRNLWKQYLRDYHLAPEALLKDGVHLNDHGCSLMAELVKPHLVLRPETKLDPFNCDTVKTYVVGKDIHWQNGKLRLEFTGNRVDLIAGAGAAAPAPVRIDDRQPSAFPELYVFTRAVAPPDEKWPFILKIGWQKPRLIEEWTLTFHDVPADEKRCTFSVTGTMTGPDGDGVTTERFVSKSGRIVIEPADWDLHYIAAKETPLKPGVQLRWHVRPQCVDEFIAGAERVVTLAQGLANTKHTLEITGSPATPVTAIHIYRPPSRHLTSGTVKHSITP